MDWRSHKAKPIVAGWAFILFALLFGVSAIREVMAVRATKSWDVVDGRIVGSSVAKIDPLYDGYRRRSFSKPKGPTFKPSVLYTYTVRENDHNGSRLFAGTDNGFKSAAEARAVVDRYPRGKQVRAYVNSNRASEAVLEQGHYERVWYYLKGVSAALALSALLFFAARFIND